MSNAHSNVPDEVAYVNGRTRLFGIVGHPIEQVKSPELFGAEFERRGVNALMLPLHVLPDEFDATIGGLMRLANLDGLVFTIPYKARAVPVAGKIGSNGTKVGAINALRRNADGGWEGDIFDGIGCVEAFRRRGLGFKGKTVQILGAGGAGAAIAVAVAHEAPARLRLFDPDAARAAELAARVKRVDPAIDTTTGPASVEGADILINASPIGMLGDARLPLPVEKLAAGLVVFDAVVKPEVTPLLKLAREGGCVAFGGREMMLGQISKMVDFFGYEAAR